MPPSPPLTSRRARQTRRDEKDSNVGANALLFLAGLYNLGGLHCRLLYELIETLVARFGELELPLLSLLLRSVGASLRSDDPAALKQIIVQVLLPLPCGASTPPLCCLCASR